MRNGRTRLIMLPTHGERIMNGRKFVLLSATLLIISGCATSRNAYYNAWEKMGYAKRERLVDNVKDASAEQGKAKQEFANALEQFRSVVNFEGGDLEKVYNKLNKSY